MRRRTGRRRYHKIGHDGAAIERLFVDLFLDAHGKPPAQITLDLDATDDPVHGRQEGRFFHGYYDCWCYLPLYVFCGRHLLAAKLRRSNMDASAGAIEEVERIVQQIRRRWSRVKILLRADSGFARDALMSWCEHHQVDYVFGLARNARLEAELEGELAVVEATSRDTGQPVRRFKEFWWATQDSWSRRRRVSPKPNGRMAGPILASWSPRSARPPATPAGSTRTSTARAARWKTGSKNASSTRVTTPARIEADGSARPDSRPDPHPARSPSRSPPCPNRSGRTPPPCEKSGLDSRVGHGKAHPRGWVAAARRQPQRPYQRGTGKAMWQRPWGSRASAQA